MKKLSYKLQTILIVALYVAAICALAFAIILIIDNRILLNGTVILAVVSVVAAILLLSLLVIIFRRRLHHGMLANMIKREANLKLHTKELQVVLQNISEGLITVDRNGNIWSVNDAAMQLTGFSRKQLVGHNIVSVFNISDNEGTKLDVLIANALRGNEKIILPEDTMLTQRDGKMIPIAGTFSPTLNELNLLTGFVVTFNDNSNMYYKKQLLEQGNDSYLTIFNRNPHPMCIYDLEQYEVQMSNQAVNKILGYTVDEVLNTSIFKYLSSQFATMMKTADPSLQKKIQNDDKCYIVKKNGEQICMNKVSMAIKFNGKPCRYVLFSEITDEKLAADITSLQRRYKQMMDSMPEAILVHNMNEKITYVNQYCTKLFHADSPDQLIGRNLKSVYAEGVFDSIRAQISKITTRQKSATEANREMVCVDGTKFFATIVGTSFMINDEMFVQVLIKEQEDVIETASGSKDNDFRNLTDIGDLQIWKFDTNGNLIYANTALTYFVGDAGKAFLNNDDWRNLIHPDDRETRLPAAKQLVSRCEDVQTELRILCGNGNYYWFYICATPNFDSTGKLLGYMGYNININRRKLAEIEMEKAKKQAEESSRLKSSFLSILSHEIRTPMNAIIGFTDLLKMQNTPENTAKYVDIIQRNGYNLLSIITNTVEASKIDSNQIAVNREKFDIQKLADEVFNDAKNRNDNNLMMTHNNQLPQKMIIVSDKFKIRQVLNYVLDNALKYTPSGSVTMESHVRDGKIVFSVVDTGIGVGDNDKKRIFNMFYRVDNLNTIQSRGAGLGLPISQAYIDVLHGKMEFNSSLDVGTMVTIEIPCDQEFNEQQHEPESNLFAKQKNKILVAEDDEFNAIYIGTILEGLGYQVKLAYDGEAAVQAVHDDTDIKLVLMDLQMPIIDGFEAMNQIREFNKTVPIIAQTSFALSEFRHKMKGYEFDDVLYKPLQKDRLLELVAKHLKEN